MFAPISANGLISLWHFRCLRMGKSDAITYNYVINVCHMHWWGFGSYMLSIKYIVIAQWQLKRFVMRAFCLLRKYSYLCNNIPIWGDNIITFWMYNTKWKKTKEKQHWKTKWCHADCFKSTCYERKVWTVIPPISTTERTITSQTCSVLFDW